MDRDDETRPTPPADPAGAGAVVEFDGTIENLVWGRSTYTVLRLPDALVRAAARVRTRRVAGTIEEAEVNLAITRVRHLGAPFVYTGAAFLRTIATEPGEPVRCRLGPVDPDRVDVPADVSRALEREGLGEVWLARRPGARRRDLAQIESASRTATRERRLDDLLDALRAERRR